MTTEHKPERATFLVRKNGTLDVTAINAGDSIFVTTDLSQVAERDGAWRPGSHNILPPGTVLIRPLEPSQPHLIFRTVADAMSGLDQAGDFYDGILLEPGEYDRLIEVEAVIDQLRSFASGTEYPQLLKRLRVLLIHSRDPAKAAMYSHLRFLRELEQSGELARGTVEERMEVISALSGTRRDAADAAHDWVKQTQSGLQVLLRTCERTRHRVSLAVLEGMNDPALSTKAAPNLDVINRLRGQITATVNMLKGQYLPQPYRAFLVVAASHLQMAGRAMQELRNHSARIHLNKVRAHLRTLHVWYLVTSVRSQLKRRPVTPEQQQDMLLMLVAHCTVIGGDRVPNLHWATLQEKDAVIRALSTFRQGLLDGIDN